MPQKTYRIDQIKRAPTQRSIDGAIICDGYRFIRNKINSGVEYFSCYDCKIPATLKGDIFSVNDSHSDHPKPTKLIAKFELIANCKSEIKRDPSQSNGTVYKNAVINLNSLNVPTNKSLASTIQRAKAELIPAARSNERMQIAINESFKLTLIDNQEFLQFDVQSEDDYRMFIFFTQQFFELICKNDLLILDGTFYSAPDHFYQVYIFHFSVGDGFLPGIYVLMPDKSALSYEIIFSLLKDKANSLGYSFQPEEIIVDFEKGMLKSLKNQLDRSIRIRGCFFHFCQALLKNLTTNELKLLYLNDKKFHNLIRKIMALAFLKIDMINDQFQKIKNELTIHYINNQTCNYGSNVKKYLDYVEKTWMNDAAIYPKELWNQYKKRNRTINAAEGFNRGFNDNFSSAHPNVHQLINAIRKEQMNSTILYNNYLRTGRLDKIKNKKYVTMQGKIDEYYDQLENGEMDVDDFLNRIQFLLSDI